MKKIQRHTLGLAVLLFTASAPLMAGNFVVYLRPEKDATLYEQAQGTLASGSGEHLIVGRTAGKGDVRTRRALLAFDVAQLPDGSTIESVIFSLTVNRTMSGPQEIEMRAVTSDWGEGASDAGGSPGQGASSEAGDATWIHTFFENQFWSVAGGDFSTQVSATRAVDKVGAYVWGTTAVLEADVQGWYDDPSTNFGWILLGNESADQTAKRFGSRERTEAVERPLLRLEFSNPDLLFFDGFESGNTLAWSSTVP